MFLFINNHSIVYRLSFLDQHLLLTSTYHIHIVHTLPSRPLSVLHLPIGIHILAVPVLEVVAPVPLPGPAIPEIVCPLATSGPISELALIPGGLVEDHDPMPMHLALIPLAAELAPVCMFQHSIAVEVAVEEVTLVDGPIAEGELPLACFGTQLELALVHCAVRHFVGPIAVRLIINPAPFVD